MRANAATASLLLLLSSCATVEEREAMRRQIELDCEDFLGRVGAARTGLLAGSMTGAEKYSRLQELSDKFELPTIQILIAVELNRFNQGGTDNLEICVESIGTLKNRFAAARN
jgi:hypothetical protein